MKISYNVLTYIFTVVHIKLDVTESGRTLLYSQICIKIFFDWIEKFEQTLHLFFTPFSCFFFPSYSNIFISTPVSCCYNSSLSLFTVKWIQKRKWEVLFTLYSRHVNIVTQSRHNEAPRLHWAAREFPQPLFLKDRYSICLHSQIT